MTMWVPFCYRRDRLDHLHWTTQIPGPFRALLILNSQEKIVPGQYYIFKACNIVAAHLAETFLCRMSNILLCLIGFRPLPTKRSGHNNEENNREI
jgi:hypothetical protein